MVKPSTRLCVSALIAGLLAPALVFGWGERGHDVVTRCAVRHLAEEMGDDDRLTRPLLGKENMLGHLSNVPDIFWRGIDKATTDANHPSHFLDSDFLGPLTLATVPRTISEARTRVQGLCADPPESYICPEPWGGHQETMEIVGISPWRIVQLVAAIEAALVRYGESDDRKVQTEAGEDALRNMGILSHFIGDLANPHHASRDYDSWETNQGGLHSYFEGRVVDALDYSLDDRVLRMARRQPARDLLDGLGSDRDDPLMVAWALILDSRAHLEEMAAIDRRHALLEESRVEKDPEGKDRQIKAKRRPPAEVAKKFRKLIVRRMAIGADLLAHVWKGAWERAGRPDLTRWWSWNYPLAPEFIPPPTD